MSDELHILQHSLGVDQYGRGDQYRNHFVASEGSADHGLCMALVTKGLMNVRRGWQLLPSDDDLFVVTEAGMRWMAENSPAPPKLTRGQQRYAEWLRISDVCEISFGDWLKGRRPA